MSLRSPFGRLFVCFGRTTSQCRPFYRAFSTSRPVLAHVIQVNPPTFQHFSSPQAIAELWAAHQKARRRRILRNLVFFFTGFGGILYFFRSIDKVTVTEAIDHALDHHNPLVEELRMGAATKPLNQCYQEINLTPRSPGATLTQETLNGPYMLGPQRAFWSSSKKELILVAWFGSRLSGWPTVAHGGSIATVMSDAMSRAVGCIYPSNGKSTSPAASPSISLFIDVC